MNKNNKTYICFNCQKTLLLEEIANCTLHGYCCEKCANNMLYEGV